MENRLTLIIDGNWLFMTRIFSCSRELKKDLPIAYSHLQSGFLTSINKVMTDIPLIDNFIVLSDAGSWRKQVKIPDGVEVTYKGNRTKDKMYNWDKIWDTWEDLKTKLKDAGVCVSDTQYIEGDDWAAYWSHKLRKEGICNIILTKDHDLRQLIDQEPDGTWTGWYNEKDGLILHEKQSLDNKFFSVLTTGDAMVTEIMRYIKSGISYIDPKPEIIVEKIILGDVSDNIMPIIWTNKTKSGISKKKYKLPKKNVPYDLDIYNDEQIDAFIRKQLKNEKYSHLTFESVRAHFDYNRKLVVLSTDVYPESVRRRITESAPAYTLTGRTVSINTNPQNKNIDKIIDLL